MKHEAWGYDRTGDMAKFCERWRKFSMKGFLEGRSKWCSDVKDWKAFPARFRHSIIDNKAKA